MVTEWLIWCFGWGLLCLLLCAGRLVAAPRGLAMAALACALHAGALVVPHWQFWAAKLGYDPPIPAAEASLHQIGWTSKAAALLVSLSLVYGLHWVRPAEAGLGRPQAGSLRAVGLVVAAVIAGVLLVSYWQRPGYATLWWQQQLYVSVVPGLEEELFFRGVLLGLLSHVFRRSLPLPGTATSWGGLVTILLFVLGHGIRYPPADLFEHNTSWLLTHAYAWHWFIHFVPADVAYQTIMASIFLWVRERTGSVWPAVAAHCLVNTATMLGHAIT